MHIFLDTANIDQIRQGVRLGVVSGVTTNPSLVSKEGIANYEATIKEICAIVPGPVSAEVVTEKAGEMIDQARHIATWAPNVVIKIPASPDGLEVTSVLARENIKVNFTLCFSLNQALLGALAGAAYVSPFVGRLDAVGHDGMEVVHQMRTIFDNYGFPTQILVAAVRHPGHVLEAAMAGADACTMAHDVLLQLYDHPMTDLGIEQFLKDWKKVPQE